MEEKLRTAFELLFEETTASTTELVKSTTERLRNEKNNNGATPRLHHHHHHGTRIGTHHVVPGGLLPPWTPIFVKFSIFSYQIRKNSRLTGPPEVSLSQVIAHP